MHPNPKITLPLRLRLRGKPAAGGERSALRAALSAAHLLGLATGVHLRGLRSRSDPLLDLKAQLDEAQLQGRLAWQVVEILSRRFAKIPERRRPYYSPGERYRILEIRNLLGWSRRTLKDNASLRLQRPLTMKDLERRLETTLTHYLCFRPHQGLDGATPAEAFLGLEPASKRAVPPPRGRPGEGSINAPFAVAFLDPERAAFPVLVAA